MAFVEGLTYLVATLNQHEKPASLLLHHVLEVTLTDIPVTVPSGFDLDKFTSTELSFPLGDNIKLEALFSKKSDCEHLQETPISEDQIITEREDGWLLQATVMDSHQLRWWIRGFGERVKVIDPRELHDEFKQMANTLANLYV